MLRKTPAFTIAAVLTLALAIGANTAMYSVIDAVLLRPLPYPHPDRLVAIWERLPSGVRNVASVPTFLDWRQRAKSFEELAATSNRNAAVQQGDHPLDIAMFDVTTNYFALLGIVPEIGRTFTPQDGVSGHEHSVVLTNAAWRDLFRGDRKVIGTTVSLDGTPYEVIGVLPPNSFLDSRQEKMFAPMVLNPADSRSSHNLTVYGRLAPGATLASARSEMSVIAAAISAEHPDTNGGWTVAVDPLHDTVVGNRLKDSLLVLFGAVVFILLVGCANVANLMLVRATARQKEFAVRAALGASRTQLVRQLMTESALISLFGVVSAVVLGWWLLRLVMALMPDGMLPPGTTVHMNANVLIFTCVVGIVTAVIAGLAPAIQGSKVDLNATLKEDGRVSGTSRERQRLRNVLVVAEVAFAFALLTGAGLLVTALARLLRVDPGFDSSHVLAAHMVLPSGRYATPEHMQQFRREAEERLKALPGVQHVAFSTDLPLRGWMFGSAFQPEGLSSDPSHRPFAHLQSVTDDYFQTLHIAMLNGRTFTPADNEHSSPVVIINQTLAEMYFHGENPVGRHLFTDFGIGGNDATHVAWEIVGVSSRVKVTGLSEALTRAPEIYIPAAQIPTPAIWVALRTSGDPMALRTALERALHSIDPALPLTSIGPMDVVLQQASLPARFYLRLFGAFAALGLMLAAIGIYSVRSYTVGQRVPEIGVRMALGATPFNILRLFMTEGVAIVCTGIVLGGIMSVALTRTMTSLLYSVRPNDPAILIACAAVMALMGASASFLPARRAASVDPMEALHG
jgi:putative ABC transport system permease protein